MPLTHRRMITAAILSLGAGTLVFHDTISWISDPHVTTGRARLAIAKISPDGADTTFGVTRDTVYYYGPDTAVFVWDAPDTGRVAYLYQVTSRPFPGGFPKRAVLGAVDGGITTSRSFTVDMSDFWQRVGGWKDSRDFFIRIVPVIDGTIVGPASNTVVLHYILGDDPDGEIIVEDWDALLGHRNDTVPPPQAPQRDRY